MLWRSRGKPANKGSRDAALARPKNLLLNTGSSGQYTGVVKFGNLDLECQSTRPSKIRGLEL
jgi:hypothetical protein